MTVWTGALLGFLLGGILGAVFYWRFIGRKERVQQTVLQETNWEPSPLADAEERAFLKQYRNFLIYSGSGKGQEPIETEN